MITRIDYLNWEIENTQTLIQKQNVRIEEIKGRIRKNWDKVKRLRKEVEELGKL